MDTVNPVLARKLGLAAKPKETTQDEAPVTPMRLMRRALERAADKAVGMSASVLGISEEDQEAESLIDDGPDGWVVLGLRDNHNAGLKGLFLIDPVLRSALVEMQTLGYLQPPAAEQRPVTMTDAGMSIPFAERLLSELAEVGFGGSDVTTTGYDMGPISDLRTAGLVMVQGLYRCWRVTIQMGGGEAQGEMLIAVQPKITQAAVEEPRSVAWGDALRLALADAPAELDAVLCKMAMPIRAVEGLNVGQILHLAGTTVGSVTLVGSDGKTVAPARLGQLAGKRAVRVETPTIEMEESQPAYGQSAMMGTGLLGQDQLESEPMEEEPMEEVAFEAAPFESSPMDIEPMTAGVMDGDLPMDDAADADDDGIVAMDAFQADMIDIDT